MLVNDKYYNATISLFIGIVVFIVGLMLLVFNEVLYKGAINLLLILLMINGIIQLTYSIRKKNNGSNIIKCLLNLFIALILNLIPSIPQSIYPLLLGVYLVFYGVIKMFIFFLYKKNNIAKRKRELIESLFLFYLAYIIAINPLRNLIIILYVTGIYFMFLGTSFIVNSIFKFIPNKVKKKIVINLPFVFEAFIPYSFFLNINKMLETDDNLDKIINHNETSSKLELLVHVGSKGYGKVGHVDIIFNDVVISYGNYDYKSRKLFESIGDGVLFTTHKKEYIRFCIEHSHKMLFGFGINISEEQAKELDKKIIEIINTCDEWKNDKKKKDYAYHLHKATKAKFYKFREGKYKTYFLFNTSCCAIPNEIIGVNGIDLLKMNGIITPGTYYDKLNREYVNKTGLILYRNIYTEKSFNSYFK